MPVIQSINCKSSFVTSGIAEVGVDGANNDSVDKKCMEHTTTTEMHQTKYNGRDNSSGRCFIAQC